MSGAAARPWRSATAVVAAQRDFGAGLLWLDLDLPRGFAAPVAGQFVMLQLPSPSPVLLPRPMSVAAATRRGSALRIGCLYAPVGIGTRALAALGAGARVTVTGPLGRGFPLAEPGVPVLLAGGRGLAPLLMAADALARRGRPATLLVGARTRTLLAGLEDAHARLAAVGGAVHVATDDGSFGARGTVLDVLERLAPRFDGAPVLHACGPHAMLGAIARWALARGVRAHLAMESVMACGTGVCRGCPLPRSAESRARVAASAGAPGGSPEWAMCCTDGPVFAATELDWERVE